MMQFSRAFLNYYYTHYHFCLTCILQFGNFSEPDITEAEELDLNTPSEQAKLSPMGHSTLSPSAVLDPISRDTKSPSTPMLTTSKLVIFQLEPFKIKI